MIINHWSESFTQLYGGRFPDSYFCFDVETTGFSRDRDVVVEWGHCLVRNRQPVDRISVIINWFGSGLLGPDGDEWLSTQLRKVKRRMELNGRSFHVTEEVMRERGVSPHKVLPWLLDLLDEIREQSMMFVSHNGWNYDYEMLQAHFRDFVDEEWELGDNQMFDTGAIEKATLIVAEEHDTSVLPRADDTLKSYFKRIAYRRAPGIKWNLDGWCVQKYDLVEKHGVDVSQTHSADYDAWLLHLLMEEFRHLAGATEPSVPKIKDAVPKSATKPLKARTQPRDRPARETQQAGQRRRRGQRNS
jgi:hypothetical protein